MEVVGAVENVSTPGNTLARMVRAIQQRNIVPTHFLMVQVSYHALLHDKYKGRVRRALHEAVANRRFEVSLGDPGDADDKVFIRWQSVNRQSSMMYYTTSRFEEMYVRQLTGRLLREAYHDIMAETDLNPGNFQLSFITTKNLDYMIDLERGQEQAFGVVQALQGGAPPPAAIAAAQPGALQRGAPVLQAGAGPAGGDASGAEDDHEPVDEVDRAVAALAPQLAMMSPPPE